MHPYNLFRIWPLLARGFLALVLSIAPGAMARADSNATPWGLPEAASTITINVDDFYHLLLMVTAGISVFVFLLLGIVIIRFRRSANPIPSKRTANAPLEVLWTLIPLLILIGIAFPSTKLLYYMDKAKNPELTVKITGYQWYWGYEFPEQKVKYSPGDPISVDEYYSNYIHDEDIDPKKGQKRLLSVDSPLVLPVDTEIQFLITGGDVIHSWYVPSIGINQSAIPGRTNEAWAKITHEGVFYGQCTQICGLNHGYMPIEIRVVSREKFMAWVSLAKTQGVDKANAMILGLTTSFLFNAEPGHIALASASPPAGNVTHG